MTTLTYFDFDASRGLECRLALTLAGVDFTDHRIQRQQWGELKPTMPYGALPVLEEGGRKVAQSNAILRYVGIQHGLYPTDAWTAAEHDALLQSVEDLRYKMPGSGLSDEEKKTAREEFAAGWLAQWAATIDARLQGPFLEGDSLGVADIKLYTILRAFMAGVYDHIPASVFDGYPKIPAFYAAVDAHPAVRGWFERG